MKQKSVEDGLISVQLDEEELITLANALNEAREAIDEWEFEIRMGVSLETAERLQEQISYALQQLRGTAS